MAFDAKGLPRRTSKVVFGLFLFSVGTYMTIQANIGLAPWSAFSMGISAASGISYGNVTTLASLVILVIDCFLGEKLGVGTILDALSIGVFVDLLLYAGLLPQCGGFASGLFVLLLGQMLVSVGSYFYIAPGLGCGPRDLLMVALGKRAPKTPIGVVRGLIEGTALVIGWLFGAKAGIGTVVSVFGIGFILEYTFKALNFDVRAVEHEDALTSLRKIWPR
ncbi:MAG: hypothetical protein LBQ36_01505 [Synergistaceae bacterium]|nr:hypothetical protein [Synergistaceae bacterium]